MLYKDKLYKDKNALSEIVSYTLLILIAISISFVVFTWLKLQVPKNQQECPDNVHLVIKDFACDNNFYRINLTVENKGLFNIDGFFIRASIQNGGEIVYPLTPEKKVVGTSKGLVFFLQGVSTATLKPGEEYSDNFYYSNNSDFQSDKIYDIEIQPIKILVNNTQVVCENAIIKQSVNCGV